MRNSFRRSVKIEIVACSMANKFSLHERFFVLFSQLYSGQPALPRTQERQSLLLLLSWLRLASNAAESEWIRLRCEKYKEEAMEFPVVPEMTTAERAAVGFDVDVLWRRPDEEAIAYLYRAMDADDAAGAQTTFLFNPAFHESLCILKTNHRRMIVQAAVSLSSFL